MGVGVGAGVEVAVGCEVEVTVGVSVSIGCGVAGGWGGVLTHAANPINKRISQKHFALLTATPTRWIMIFESYAVDSCLLQQYSTQSSSSRSPT